MFPLAAVAPAMRRREVATTYNQDDDEGTASAKQLTDTRCNREATEVSEERTIGVSTKRLVACTASQNTPDLETERAAFKPQTSMHVEPSSIVVDLTSACTQSCSKVASKTQRGSDVAPAWQAPSSKFRGVTRHRRSGRWEANIWLGKGINKQIYLGSYEKEELAAEAYDVASLKAKGLSAATNFSKERYMWLWNEIDRCSMEELVLAVKRGSQGFARGCSSYRGVSRHFSGKYEARMGVGGSKYVYLGMYAEQLDAANAYDECAVRLKGQQAATNFQVANYARQVKERKLKQLETKKPEVFHALRCHAYAEHALAQLPDREVPTDRPFSSETSTGIPTAAFPCRTEIPDGLRNPRMAVVVAATLKNCSAVTSGMSGMHTPAAGSAAAMPPLPTPEEVALSDSNSTNWGVLQETMQEWLKSGYPDKEFYALDRVLSRITGQKDQNDADNAKQLKQDCEDRRKSTSSLQRSLSFSNMGLVSGETKVPWPAATTEDSAERGLRVSAAATAFKFSQAVQPMGAEAAWTAAGATGSAVGAAATPYMVKDSGEPQARKPAVAAAMRSVADGVRMAAAATESDFALAAPSAVCATTGLAARAPGSTAGTAATPAAPAAAKDAPALAAGASKVPSMFSLPGAADTFFKRASSVSTSMHSDTYALSAAPASKPTSNPSSNRSSWSALPATLDTILRKPVPLSGSSELDDFAAQLHGSLEEKVEVIAAHAAAQAIRTQTSYILQNDVLGNALRTLTNQQDLNPPSQAAPSETLFTATQSPSRKRACREVPRSRSDITRVSDPSSIPSSLLGADKDSSFVTPGSFARQRSAFKPVISTVHTDVHLPMPLHAAAGFPCAAATRTQADVSTRGSSTPNHACTEPQLPYAKKLIPSHDAAEVVVPLASWDTGTHAGTAQIGSHSSAPCMLQPQLPVADVGAALCGHHQPQTQLLQESLVQHVPHQQQQLVPQQHPHMLPILPMLPNASSVPASSFMWQQPPSVVPMIVPAVQPRVHNSFHLWPQASSAVTSHP